MSTTWVYIRDMTYGTVVRCLGGSFRELQTSRGCGQTRKLYEKGPMGFLKPQKCLRGVWDFSKPEANSAESLKKGATRVLGFELSSARTPLRPVLTQNYWSIFLCRYSCPSSEYRPKYRFASEGNRIVKKHEIREKANGRLTDQLHDHGADAAPMSEE